MFHFFRDRWESGSGAYLIEELIGCAFNDFAPYAGAEQQQTRLVRRQTDGTTTKIAYDNGGSWSVSLGNPYVGGVSFSTAPDLFCDLQLRVPLRLPKDVVERNMEKGIISPTASPSVGSEGETRAVQVMPLTPCLAPYDSRSPSQYASPPPRGPTGCCGMVELLYSYLTSACGAGVRMGPASLRAMVVPGSVHSAGSSDDRALIRTSSCVVDSSWRFPLGGSLPYDLTVALQHPFMAVEGDTVAALALERSASNASNGEVHDDFRFLIVQTLATKSGFVKQQLSDATFRSRGAILVGNKNWSELGTLVGVQKTFSKLRVRLSAAAMLHGREMDYEVSTLMDVTHLFSSPMVLRLGFNKTRRVAAGIATEVLKGLSLTLGIHYLDGDLRFGLEASL